MAYILDTIDTLARRLGRDVLYLTLPDQVSFDLDPITTWLDEQGFGWCLCFAFSEDSVYVEGGPTCLYIDLPYDESCERVRQVDDHFNDKSGTPVIAEVETSLLRLQDAARNAHQDAPDFWENW